MISEGENIHISGSDFGNGPDLLLFDDFEKGSNGVAVPTGAGSAEVGQWTDNIESAAYSTNQKVSGSKALHVHNMTGETPSYNILISTIPSQTKVFVSWRLWIDLLPVNLPNGSANWKNIWLLGDTSTTYYDMTIPTFFGPDGNGIYTGNDISANCGGYGNWNVPSLTTGAWKRTWVMVDGNARGSYLQSWELTPTGVNALPIAGWELFIPQVLSINDCTNLSIATPTSWNSSSISATVRQGSFGPFDSAYLYVIDANGAVNASGYPITFGSSSSSDESVPSAPSGLSVM